MAAWSLLTLSAAAQTGLTGLEWPPEPVEILPDPASPAPAARPLPAPGNYRWPGLDGADDWELIARDSLTTTIPAGGRLAVYFDPAGEMIGFQDPAVELSPTQAAALARTPAWLRADLYDSFRRFYYPMIADLVAEEILNAPDPLVDEIAFQAAHIAPEIIGGAMFLELLRENAEYVYLADSALDYVQIVDYGASGDDDYWSTARYRVVEESGDTVEVEIDREIYYWYLVHPKLSDEMPTYINPANGEIAAPPDGVFWRTYFWTHADSGYSHLSQELDGCPVLWAHRVNTAGSSNGAVGLVNDWVNEAMNWAVGPERPIQPVRIYALHQGYCGEHSDITAAAGRTALIPTVCTIAFCEDHTWNEFWDRDWIHWEPVNNMVNSPLSYENGWGKVFASVINFRGDGFVWGVTERYSEGLCTLTITVRDSCGKPVDGEKVALKSTMTGGGQYYTTWSVTDAEGQATLTLGDNRPFYVRVSGPLGAYPSSSTQYASVITNSQAGQNYTWDCSISNASPALGVTEAPPYPNPDDTYRLEVQYETLYETAYASIFLANEFSEKLYGGGGTDLFLADSLNLAAYDSLQPAQGFEITPGAASGTLDFVLPTFEPWYAVFSARELTVNSQRVKAVVSAYRYSSGVVPGSGAQPARFTLHPTHPNPFNPTTALSYELRAASYVRLRVYDTAGREVRALVDGWRDAGVHEVTFDGSGLASGVYLVRLEAGEFTQTEKIVLLK
ncbi:MAG: T9SS C-terminal target domain-containing protein [Candidatus Zixiibacteriota bacterium]|nr:MAG: T9SS C-terminal target domain-containing protein [candidate division Zixibacteria bacterium]